MITIFLEIDGVLNSTKSLSFAPDNSIGIDTDKVKVLREIIKRSNAVLILASERWNKEWNIEDEKCSDIGKYLNKKLNRNGVHITESVDDIEEYLQKKLYAQPHIVLSSKYEKNNEAFVHVDEDTGLTDVYTDVCVKLLQEET